MSENWISELSALLGEDIVLTDRQVILAHSVDRWPAAIKARQQGLQPWQPQVVVRPTTVEQVQQILAWASERAVPITPWGSGSGVTGAALATQGGIILDMTAFNRVKLLDEENLIVQVEAGMNGLELEKILNQRGYTLNHSPQSLELSTVGGWIATRAVGQFSSRWGGIENLAIGLTSVLASGEIVSTPLGPRASMGSDILNLFIGSEGTLGVISDVTLRIFPLPEYRCFESLTFPDLPDGIQAMRQLMRSGLRPFLARLYDQDEARHVMGNPSFPSCLLFLGFEGVEDVARAEYRSALSICASNGGDALGAEPALSWMERRFDFSMVENRLNQVGGYAETIDVADFWSGIYHTYQALKIGLSPYADEVFGHFSHVYPQGTSLYMIMLGQAQDDAAAGAKLEAIWRTAMQICLERKAVLSHHHGVGLVRSPYMQEALGSSLVVLERVKKALDAAGVLNPGKLGLS
jgi:alkyldihydroxyacetonephosphate synthase